MTQSKSLNLAIFVFFYFKLKRWQIFSSVISLYKKLVTIIRGGAIAQTAFTVDRPLDTLAESLHYECYTWTNAFLAIKTEYKYLS